VKGPGPFSLNPECLPHCQEGDRREFPDSYDLCDMRNNVSFDFLAHLSHSLEI
jgi:hypothetical protein